MHEILVGLPMIGTQLLTLMNDLSIATDILLNNIHWVMIGIAIGMFMGTIPGMGGSVTLALLLPFTLGMDQFAAFALLAAALGATTFSGSITAILVNTPGTTSNAATLLDGYPLTKQGKGAYAIGASAASSALGAIFAITIFILAIPLVIQLVLLFGLSEMFWLILIGIFIVTVVAGDRFLGAMIVAGFGVFLAFIGTAPATGEYRFTYDTVYLMGGLALIPPIVGLFAISEMLRLVTTGSDQISDSTTDISAGKWEGVKKAIEEKFLVLRCSMIGLVVGAIPGIGGLGSTFLAYGHAVQSSKDPDSFGKGNIQGVIAAESANDAKDGGQLFPTLGLGIPGSGSTAILLAGFLMHGLEIGPRLLLDNTHLMLVIALSLLVSNIVTSVVGLGIADQVTKVTSIPISRLFPVIIIASLVSSFLVRNSFWDMIVAVLFGVLGLILIWFGISRVPFIIAFVLAGMLEKNYQQALTLARGDVYGAFFTGTVNIILIVLFIITILLPIMQQLDVRRVLGEVA